MNKACHISMCGVVLCLAARTFKYTHTESKCQVLGTSRCFLTWRATGQVGVLGPKLKKVASLESKSASQHVKAAYYDKTNAKIITVALDIASLRRNIII